MKTKKSHFLIHCKATNKNLKVHLYHHGQLQQVLYINVIMCTLVLRLYLYGMLKVCRVYGKPNHINIFMYTGYTCLYIPKIAEAKTWEERS